MDNKAGQFFRKCYASSPLNFSNSVTILEQIVAGKIKIDELKNAIAIIDKPHDSSGGFTKALINCLRSSNNTDKDISFKIMDELNKLTKKESKTTEVTKKAKKILHAINKDMQQNAAKYPSNLLKKYREESSPPIRNGKEEVVSHLLYKL